jgi:hypothetical protein
VQYRKLKITFSNTLLGVVLIFETGTTRTEASGIQIDAANLAAHYLNAPKVLRRVAFAYWQRGAY